MNDLPLSNILAALVTSGMPWPSDSGHNSDDGDDGSDGDGNGDDNGNNDDDDDGSSDDDSWPSSGGDNW